MRVLGIIVSLLVAGAILGGCSMTGSDWAAANRAVEEKIEADRRNNEFYSNYAESLPLPAPVEGSPSRPKREGRHAEK